MHAGFGFPLHDDDKEEDEEEEENEEKVEEDEEEKGVGPSALDPFVLAFFCQYKWGQFRCLSGTFCTKFLHTIFAWKWEYLKKWYKVSTQNIYWKI